MKAQRRKARHALLTVSAAVAALLLAPMVALNPCLSSMEVGDRRICAADLRGSPPEPGWSAAS